MKAFCSGCRASPSAKPSTVVMSRPWYWTASARQLLIRSPSTRTVQAPQAPWLQPFLEPVRPRWSRNRSRREVRRSTLAVIARPLIRKFIGSLLSDANGRLAGLFPGATLARDDNGDLLGHLQG